MMNEGLSASDVALLSGNGGRNSDGFGDGNGWWIILFFLCMFGWGGYGNGFGGYGGASGALTRADLCQDMNFQSLENAARGIQQGICDSTYALNNAIQSAASTNQLQLCNGFNGVQSQISNVGFQLQDCCCQTQRAIDGVNYNMATNTCSLQNTMNSNTRDLLENQNSNTRAILDYLCQDKISTLQAENQSLKLAASQATQNSVLMAAMDANTAEIVRRTNPTPVPAYTVPAPYPYGGCGCNTGCGTCC